MSYLNAVLNRFWAKRSIGALLKRVDDHLLTDIGVTRADLRALLDGMSASQMETGRIAPLATRPVMESLQRVARAA